MSLKNDLANWAPEIKNHGSIEAAIIDRLKFHGGLFLTTMTREYGLCANTILKHMRRLEKRGVVSVCVGPNDIHYTYLGEKKAE